MWLRKRLIKHRNPTDNKSLNDGRKFQWCNFTSFQMCWEVHLGAGISAEPVKPQSTDSMLCPLPRTPKYSPEMRAFPMILSPRTLRGRGSWQVHPGLLCEWINIKMCTNFKNKTKQFSSLFQLPLPPCPANRCFPWCLWPRVACRARAPRAMGQLLYSSAEEFLVSNLTSPKHETSFVFFQQHI